MIYMYMYTYYQDLYIEISDINERTEIQVHRDKLVREWMQKENISFPMNHDNWIRIRDKFRQFTIDCEKSGFMFCVNGPNGRCHYVYNGEWKEYDNQRKLIEEIKSLSPLFDDDSKLACVTYKI